MRYGQTIVAMATCILFLTGLDLGSTGRLSAQQPSLAPIQRPVAMVTRSFPVKHLAVESAAQQVRQVLMPSEGRVFFDRSRNLVVVKGTAAAQQIAYQLLQTIDRPAVATASGPETRRYSVEAAKLGQQAALLSRRFPPSTGVQIRPDMARGQLLIVAPTEIHRQITGLLVPLAPPADSGNWTSRIQQRPMPLPRIRPANSQNRTTPSTQQAVSEDWRMRNHTSRTSLISPSAAVGGAAGFADQVSAQKLEPVQPAATANDVVTQPLPTPLAPALQPFTQEERHDSSPPSRGAVYPASRPAARVVRTYLPNETKSLDPSASETVTEEAATTAASGADGQASQNSLTFEDRLANTVSDGLAVPGQQMASAFGSLHDSVTSPVQDFVQGVHDEIASTFSDWAGGTASAAEEDQDGPPTAGLKTASSTPAQSQSKQAASTTRKLPWTAAGVATAERDRAKPVVIPVAAKVTPNRPPSVAARVVRTSPTQPLARTVLTNQPVSASGVQSARPMADQKKWRGAFPSLDNSPAVRQPKAEPQATVEAPAAVEQVVRNATPPARPVVPAVAPPVKLTPALDELPLATTSEQTLLPTARNPATPYSVVQAPPHRPVTVPQPSADPVPAVTQPSVQRPLPARDVTPRAGSVLVDSDKRLSAPPVAVNTRDRGFRPVATPAPTRGVAQRDPHVAMPNRLAVNQSSMIQLVADSDAEIGRYVARFLNLNDKDSELAGCDVRMTINDRQIWLILRRDTGTIVKLHIGEIRIDENGSRLFLYKPSSL